LVVALISPAGCELPVFCGPMPALGDGLYGGG